MTVEGGVEGGGGGGDISIVGSVPPVAPPTVKIKWAEHMNTSWLAEDCQSLAHRDSTIALYERLIENKVIVLCSINMFILLDTFEI